MERTLTYHEIVHVSSHFARDIMIYLSFQFAGWRLSYLLYAFTTHFVKSIALGSFNASSRLAYKGFWSSS